MEAILDQINSLVEQADGRARVELLDKLKAFQAKIETPYDTLQRYAGIGLELSTARMGVNLGIFKMLSESQQPMTVEAIAAKASVPPEVPSRILRHMAATHMIKESGKDTYEANSITKTLAQPGYEGGVIHFFDNMGAVLRELPEFLEDTKYADITDPTKCPFNKAFNTDLPVFMYLPSQPKRFEPMQRVMTVTQSGETPWFSVFPFEKELGDWSAGPAFVDVGGGFGHQCIALKTAYPSLDGKIILQDLPQTLSRVPKVDGIQIMEHNFFESQPVKSAKFYYLRNVLHDYPDERCIAILKNLAQAFRTGSKILIDDMVLPNTGAHWQSTQIDLTMMAALAARERTEEQWHKLIDSAGLQIESKTQYRFPKGDSIIVVVAK